MKILTEAELRAMCIAQGTAQFSVESDTFITPGAKEYLKQRGIELVLTQGGGAADKKSGGTAAYVDALSGRGYDTKPEHMTHLHGNALVMKSHSRIVFRGKLDSLEARIMSVQLAAAEQGCRQLVDELDEVYAFVRNILSAEVNEKPFESIELLGLSSQRLRFVSHHVLEEYGVDHAVPSYTLGRLCVELNLLRTAVRETELAAVEAFKTQNGVSRQDIVEALNRLSSCVYILYIRARSGEYQ